MSSLFPHSHPSGYDGNVPGPYVSAPVRSTASVVAIVAAIASFVFSSRGTESLGFILGLLAIVAGLVGGVRALSPRVRGGILSIFAVVLGVIALLFALVALVF